MLYKNLEIDKILERGARFILENPKIIEQIYRVPLYNDDPKTYQYICILRDRFKSKDSVAGGTSFDKKRALLKVIGETIERYTLSINDHAKLRNKKTYNALLKSGRKVINPQKFISFSDEQLKRFRFPNKESLGNIPFRWTEAKSLTSNHKKCLIPAQLVFAPYLHEKSEWLLRLPSSNGTAAGQSVEDALYRSICEVVERDAFMIHYLNKLKSPKFDLNSIKDIHIREIINQLRRYNLNLCLLDLTTDIMISVVGAIIIDKSGKGPAICLGLKAGLDLRENIVGAIEEALMVRSWIRDEFAYRNPDYKRSKIIQKVEDRANFWFSREKIKLLNFWLNNKAIKKFRKPGKHQIIKNRLKKVARLLKLNNLEVYYVDITTNQIKKYGFRVVKVLIPDLQPLFLDENYRYLGANRLYQVPVKMGFLKNPVSLEKLNKIPHPLL